MGVVNVTPDSFVAEIRTPELGAALARCRDLVNAGATVLDIGGESTRPGADTVPGDIELERVVPVIEAIAPELGPEIAISVDTRHESVARAAVAAGAHIINDMSSALGAVAGELGVGYVAAHMQGEPATMQHEPSYDEVVSEVLAEVLHAAEVAQQAGAGPVWVDPGIGFGKGEQHNLALLANVDRFVGAGFPVLIGVSRKGLTGRMHAASDRGVALGQAPAVPTDDRLEASLALAVWCARLGVDMVRVHDVVETVQALAVVNASGGVPQIGPVEKP